MRVELQHPEYHTQEERSAVNEIQRILCDIRKDCELDIEKLYSDMKTEIMNNGIGYEICSIPYQGSFGVENIHCGKTLLEYINDGAPEIVKIAKMVYSKEVALFRLMSEGIIMPVSGRFGDVSFAADIDLYHGNLPLYITIDMMSYARYVVVRRP